MKNTAIRSGSLVKCPACDNGRMTDDNGDHLATCTCYSYSDVADMTPGGFVALPMTQDLFDELSDIGRVEFFFTS